MGHANLDLVEPLRAALATLANPSRAKSAVYRGRCAGLATAGHRACRTFQTPRLLLLYRGLFKAAAWWDVVDDLAKRVGDVSLLSERAARKHVLGSGAIDAIP